MFWNGFDKQASRVGVMLKEMMAATKAEAARAAGAAGKIEQAVVKKAPPPNVLNYANKKKGPVAMHDAAHAAAPTPAMTAQAPAPSNPNVKTITYNKFQQPTLHEPTTKTAFWSGFDKKARELTTKARNQISDSDFALPGRRYPIHDESHARNALARVSQYGTSSEKAQVRRAVHAKFPHIGEE